jgi:hypothetical protein
MKKTLLSARFLLLAMCVALSVAVFSALYAKDEATPPKEGEWKEVFPGDKGYLDSYNKVTAKEETFSGVLKYEEQKGASTLMRWTPYKLDGVGVYVGSKDLKEYVGKKVEIIGKKNSFELEGQVVTEIWPVKIRLAAAQEPPKAAEQKEIPAKPVNGLLFEIKMLKTQPLLPGDTSFEIEYRFTNVQEKGGIQLSFLQILGSEFLRANLIGPDGKPVPMPAVDVKLAPPASPTCTLQPGCFYGGKQMVQLPQGLKPGRYSLLFIYKNMSDLKEKGFNCWTGEIASDTIVFRVAGASAKAVNGITTFVRMKKETYAAEEPVMVEVRLYNESDKEREVYSPDDMLLTYYSTGTVTDANGKAVEWKTIKTFRAPDVKYEKLAAGAALTKEYDLRSACNLPPGKYTFRLTSNIPWSAEKEKLGPSVSNEVRFEIVKPEAPKP